MHLIPFHHSIQFQSHAGSIEALPDHPMELRRVAFQSHAGSIEANVEGQCGLPNEKVSIPRWFD